MADQLIDNSGLITGACADTECPPGFEWACCEIPGEFPDAPPAIGTCELMPLGTDLYGIISEMIEVDDGTGDLLVICRKNGSTGSGSITRWDKELLTRRWKIDRTDVGNIAGDFPMGWVYDKPTGIIVTVTQHELGNPTNYVGLMCSFNVLDKSLIVHTTLAPKVGRDSAYVSYYITQMFNNNDGTFDIPTSGSGVGYTSYPPEIYQIRFSDLELTGRIPMEDITISGNLSICSTKVGNTSFVGAPGLDKVYSSTGQTLDGGTHPTRNSVVGWRLETIIFEGVERLLVFWGPTATAPIFTTSQYYKLGIFDESLNLLKEITSNSEIASTNSEGGTGFGLSFAKYGDIYYVGAPNDDRIAYTEDAAAGWIYSLDEDFNFLPMMNRPIETYAGGTKHTTAFLIANGYIYSVQHQDNIGDHYVLKCTYT